MHPLFSKTSLSVPEAFAEIRSSITDQRSLSIPIFLTWFNYLTLLMSFERIFLPKAQYYPIIPYPRVLRIPIVRRGDISVKLGHSPIFLL